MGCEVAGVRYGNEVAERARNNVELKTPVLKKDRRFWELWGGLLHCGECERRMVAHSVAPAGRKPYHYYVCPKKGEEEWRSACSNRNHRAEDLEERLREFAMRLINDPDTLREQVEQQLRAEREANSSGLQDAREGASTRKRLAQLEAVEDNYREQQAEGLITMAKLREKLEGVHEERERLEAQLAMLADTESHLRKLEELSELVEEFLRELPYLIGRETVIREYGTIGAERTPENPRRPYRLTPERIRYLSEKEVATRKRLAEAARGARFRGLYAMLGLRAVVHADGTLKISVGAIDPKKGVMSWDESS